MLNVSLPQFQVHSIIFHPFTSPGTFENVGTVDQTADCKRERSASKNVWVAGCPLLLDTNQELRGSKRKQVEYISIDMRYMSSLQDASILLLSLLFVLQMPGMNLQLSLVCR